MMEIPLRPSLAAICAMAMLFAATAAASAVRTVTLAVKNMSCATCGPIIHASLSRVSGVTRVEVSQSAGTATVAYDDSITKVSALVAATTNAGYPSHVLGVPK